jgi:hypothetical protein
MPILIRFQQLGANAFARGLDRAPERNPAFALAELEITSTCDRIEALHAYLRGWDDASLTTPVDSGADRYNGHGPQTEPCDRYRGERA